MKETRKLPKSRENPPSEVATGRSVRAFAQLCGFSVATLYKLDDKLQPRSTYLGRRRIVIESPREFMERISAAGGARTFRTKKRPS